MTASPELLLSHTDFVRRLCASLLLEPAAAEDAAQDTLVTALEDAPPSTSGRGLRNWLATVARNLVRDRHRRERRRVLREAAAARREQVPSTAHVVEREAMRARVVQAVLALPEHYRAVVLLRYFDDQPPRRIAARLRLPVESVRTRLRRGLARLRSELGDDGGRMLDAGLLPLAAPGGKLRGDDILGSVSTLHAGAAVVMLVAGAIALGNGRTAERAVAVDAVPTTTTIAALDNPTAPALRTEASPTAVVNLLSGHVLAADGALLGPALIYVNPDGPPPAGPRPMSLGAATALRRADGSAATHFSDADGGFRCDIGTAARAWVEVLWAGTAIPGAGGYFTAPATGITLHTSAPPTATLQVRLDLDGIQSTDFALECVRADGTVIQSPTCTGPVHTVALPLTTDPNGDTYEVRARSPHANGAVSVGRLLAGELRDLTLHAPGTGAIHGTVVDAGERPLADAVVFFGDLTIIRGDEPFKPFRPQRARDAVRTDAAGHFTLTGNGDLVSVFHSEASPRTVRRTEASRIRLPAFGAIAGRLLDTDGQPRPAVAVTLDRERPTTTDANGAFAFSRVAAGVRGLGLPDGSWTAVEIAADNTAMVELGRDLVDVRLRPRDPNSMRAELASAVLVGTEPIATVIPGRVDGNEVAFARARPGAYWLLTKDGPTAFCDLRTRTHDLDLGADELVVRARPGQRVFLAPAAASELVRTLAARIATRTCDADGVARFVGLPRGDYVVYDQATRQQWPTSVRSATTTLSLR